MREITPDQYAQLPPDVQQYYSFNGEMWIVEDDPTWEYLWLWYLLNFKGVITDMFGNRLTASQIRTKALKQTQAMSLQLRKSFRRALDADDPAVLLKWFDDHRETVADINRRMFDMGAIELFNEDITFDQTTYDEIKERAVKKQLDHWDNARDEVAATGALSNAGRVGMYGRGAYVAFTTGLAVTALVRGDSEERRVLGAAEHCADCVEYASLGWQPIGTLPEISDSQCMSNCRCSFEYRGENYE